VDIGQPLADAGFELSKMETVSQNTFPAAVYLAQNPRHRFFPFVSEKPEPDRTMGEPFPAQFLFGQIGVLKENICPFPALTEFFTKAKIESTYIAWLQQ